MQNLLLGLFYSVQEYTLHWGKSELQSDVSVLKWLPGKWRMENVPQNPAACKPNASINCYIFNCIITNIISNFLEYRSVVFRLYRPPSLAHTSFLLCYCFSDSNHKQIFQNICLHIYLLVDALSNSVMLSWLLWMCQIHSNASRRVLPTGHRYHRAPSGG